MTLLSFIRCRHCGLPHEADRIRCPFTNEPIETISILPAEPNAEVVGPSLVGEIIEGKYEVDSLIGEGSMGSVFAARNVHMGKRVAIKILHSNLRTVDNVRKRFMREARAAARIQHENVIRIFDAGTSDKGLPFIVMELVEGEPLDELMDREGPLPLGKALEIATQILDGLTAAHSVGVLHRDIKPENIVLCSGTRHVAKVLDFSVARVLGDSVRFTAPGEVIGTPSFLAPEQAMGEEVDHLADAWAATVVLYEMLTDRLPFEGKHLAQIVRAIVAAEYLPATSRRPGLPTEIDEIIAAGLQKDRDARADVYQLREALLDLAARLGIEELRATDEN